MNQRLTLCLLALAVLGSAAAPPGLVLIHGLLDHVSDFDQLVAWVSASNPAIDILVPDLYCGPESLAPLHEQVRAFTAAVAPFMAAHASEGVNILCFSQGNLICRAMLEEAPETWNVLNYIAVAGPLLGQYGVTSFLSPYLPAGLVTADAWELFYTPLGQEISVGNFWNDPFHEPLFLADNTFLPVVNVVPGAAINASLAARYKSAFERISGLVLIGGPQDGVITPWQSAHFGYYAPGSNSTIVPMDQQPVYLTDAFGLKTLDSRGAIATFTFPNVTHLEWRSTPVVYQTAIAPFL